MAINTGKVVTGGLAAGAVMNVCDFVNSTYIMGAAMQAEMDALNPALMAKMAGTSTMVTFLVLDFLYGIALVWTYAAMRPRFGAGAGTAMTAGILVWAISAMTWFMIVAMGLFSLSFWIKMACIMLVIMLLSAYVGGTLYKEE